MIESKFKETEIGLIPEDWGVVELKSISRRITKGTTPTTLKKKFVTEGINFVKVESIDDFGIINPKKFMFIDEETDELLKRSRIYEGDLLYSIAGTIGRVAIVPREILPANTNQAVAIIRLKEGINKKFLRYALINPKLKSFLISKTVHAVQANLSLTELGNVPIIYPPLDEQKAITKILSDLDSKIKLLQKQNATLEKIGLNLFREKVSNSENIDDIWEVLALDEIANYLNGLALQKFPPNGKGDLPVIKIRELKQGVTDKTDLANPHVPTEYIVKDGDILFSWSGSLEVVIWCGGKGALNQHLFKVTSEKYPKWFYYYWTLYHLIKFKGIAKDKATTMGHIKRKHLSESKVLIPPKEEMDKLDYIFTPIIDRIININLEIRSLQKTRDLLLPKLMSGKIRVPIEVKA